LENRRDVKSPNQSLAARINSAIVWLLLGGLLLWVTGGSALGQQGPPIQVESREVLVPVFVYDKTRMTFSSSWSDFEIRDLTLKDFHLFEDGAEQTIKEVTPRSWLADVRVSDNFGWHNEYSDTPQGKWRDPDLGPGGALPYKVHFYLVAYVPPESAKASCHRIDVKVDRRNSLVYARNEYCSTAHSASDPLNGTKFGQQMESDGVTGQPGKVSLSLQTSFFHTDANSGRVDIALEFPWNSLNRDWSNESVGSLYTLHARIGTVMMAYRKDGTLAARLSGFACCSSDFPVFVPGHLPGEASPGLDPLAIPTGYEAQIDLPPGEYNLLIVLSDGSKFGLAQAPLTVDSYDPKQIAISSVALCKRFQEAAVGSQEAAALAPKLVPLISKGIEFTPAGDTRFKKREPLFAYFEVYEPLLAGTPATTVQTQIKITNIKTGELKVDTGARSAAPWIQPGNTVIPIAEQIAVDKLPKGSYKLDVQASDSAGKSTAWRAANFTVE
jgi:hypothetical protein